MDKQVLDGQLINKGLLEVILLLKVCITTYTIEMMKMLILNYLENSNSKNQASHQRHIPMILDMYT
jgi:hypothetical protein